jgi:hypothetical protein
MNFPRCFIEVILVCGLWGKVDDAFKIVIGIITPTPVYVVRKSI